MNTQVKTDSKSLWVVNTSGNILTIAIELKNGKSGTLKIEKTWIPQDLSMQAKVGEIKSSPNFRRSLAMGLIKEQPSDEVEAMFKRDPEARAEHQRIMANGDTLASVLTPSKTDVKIVDTNKEATPEEILVTSVFDRPDQSSVKNEIRMLHNANKLTEPGILALAKKANELSYTEVVDLLKSYAE